ncbi:type VI secretion system Vgr family protein [Paludisphaera mucosa]|uniref:Type VI secretion system tip protein TssI/VgrG n=1 Tax=Paludisphaera mucosa TaxID=3030827 RepID=A0ABT6FDZ2_9BACT|nr:type VI secretion system tip protein TssI/VgrG [Paludisphaera mucosa]MDG3005796.1 type VI secretion system tip protein TssI/VgrG [Paludisphaera mucosa]
MPGYSQAQRAFSITTPLGPDRLFLVGLRGSEAISQLFHFELDLIAENAENVAFDQLLGKNVAIRMKAPGGKTRHIHGICSRFSQGGRDATFTSYGMEVVPEAWFLTRRTQSRIFQHLTIPEILKKVLAGLSVKFEIQGVFDPRDYCVQYRETDFAFASRLMEEEGIYYYFTHDEAGHKMVVANAPASHVQVPFGSTVEYMAVEGTGVEEDRLTSLEKAQELRSMKVVLWDHCFELPHKHLEAEKLIQETVQVGKVGHKLRLGEPDRLELYDWPGGYAQRHDGVEKGGGEQPSDVQKIYQDNKRTTEIRMQAEAAAAVELSGAGHFRQFTAGHGFTLKEHFNADGPYILTSVVHEARTTSDYRSGEFGETVYQNTFTCIPAGLPFRPRRTTPRPIVPGTQTAVVVGPKGEEVFVDKYGRVKVQFHWDREGKSDANSSCWIRVAQSTAGKQWGGHFWPRVGQEVVVDYLEGDVDQPIIVGSVYNPDQMPSYRLADSNDKGRKGKLISGLKSNSSLGGSGHNEFRFYDEKEKEQIFIHAQRDMETRVRKDRIELVQGSHHSIIGGENPPYGGGGDLTEEIGRDHDAHVKGRRVEHVDRDAELYVGGKQDILVRDARTENVGGDQQLIVGGDRQEKIGKSHITQAAQEIHLKAGMKVVIEAGIELTIKAGGGFVKIDASGVTIQGMMVKINCGGAADSAKSANPKELKKPAPKKPKEADDSQTGHKSSQ